MVEDEAYTSYYAFSMYAYVRKGRLAQSLITVQFAGPSLVTERSHPPYNHNFYSNGFFNPNIQHQTPPPSPSLNEALPLLTSSPTKHEKQETCCYDDEEESVTVALHIGLPNPSSADLTSMISSSSSSSKTDHVRAYPTLINYNLQNQYISLGSLSIHGQLVLSWML